jgi:hypothetical protein
MRRTVILLIVILNLSGKGEAQIPVQTVRGTVFEKETEQPLPGATVVILETDPLLAAVTGADGKFRIEHVPVGRYNLQVGFLGYEPLIIPELMVGSAKEVVVNAGLKESLVNLEEVQVRAAIRKDQPLNSMASVSARMMNMDEAHRYAGGFDDPARLASSFAGVATGFMEDNSIVVRGNAPKGLLWRLEGVEIPNPNHFADMAVLGGGGITLFSSQMLTNSDFYTGAFPAEYGNVLSGVFDIKLRNGNNEQHEHAFQAGVMGVELSSEGPFRKGGSASYLFNYRYSTFGIIKFVLPEGANVPVYQDLCFKLNFPTEHAGTFSLWGIGGIDAIKGYAETNSALWETFDDRENMKGTINTGAAGMNHKISLGSRSVLETILSASGNETGYEENYLAMDAETKIPTQDVRDLNLKYTFSGKFTTRFSPKHTNRTGIKINTINYNTDLRAGFPVGAPLIKVVDEKGGTELYQFYSQSKMEFIPGFIINAGVNLQYLAMNNEFTAEPRLGLSYKFSGGMTFNLGYGNHSQLEPLGIYLVQIERNGAIEQPNKDLRMTKSHHLVAGMDYSFNPHLRLKIEPYFQYLYDVPVISDSSYSMINMDRAWYFGSELNNKGTGMNYGVDLTLERFLHEGYYYLITASLFDSKYTGGDGIERNTMYNRNYVVNILFGKEWQVRKNRFFSINGRMHFLGGNRHIPVDPESSGLAEDVIYDYSRAYEEHNPGINQFDLTLTYRINRKNHTSSWALQILNVLGRQEFYGYSYNYKTGRVQEDEVRVIVPSISYKIDF